MNSNNGNNTTYENSRSRNGLSRVLSSVEMAAKLGVLGGAIQTFGNAIATFAEIIALQDIEQIERGSEGNGHDIRMKEMQQQIDELTRTIERMERNQRNTPS